MVSTNAPKIPIISNIVERSFERGFFDFKETRAITIIIMNAIKPKIS